MTYNKIFLCLPLLLLIPLQTSAQRLRVSDNGHYLVTTDGKPFFYLGDTAWELIHRLNRGEAALYLEKSRRKGFYCHCHPGRGPGRSGRP